MMFSKKQGTNIFLKRFTKPDHKEQLYHYIPVSLEPLSRRPRGVRNEDDLFKPAGLLRSLYGVIL